MVKRLIWPSATLTLVALASRTCKRAATRVPTLGFSLVEVERATIAFLVAFSLLVRDFFAIAMVGLLG
jgi:hypothetical protein